jgi:predicted metal-dependent enzyme (double-stranded beta helix superfamily)
MDALKRLTEAIAADVKRHGDPSGIARAVAGTLQRSLGEPDLLSTTQRRSAADGYQQHVLHVAEDGSFSIASLVWRPGQSTPIHDHVAWCVVGVYEGTEFETRYRLHDLDGALYLEEVGVVEHHSRAATWVVPPDDIHRVENRTGQTVVSIHIYGADLTRTQSSISRRFALGDEVPAGEGSLAEDSEAIGSGSRQGRRMRVQVRMD